MIKTVLIPTQDGYKLSAVVNLPKRDCPIVIIMSGYGGSNSAGKNTSHALELEKRLSQLGVGSIRFDYRGIGESTGNWQQINVTSTIIDLRAVCEYVKTLKVNLDKIALTSSSYSGGISIYACSNSNFFKTLVTVSGVFDWNKVNHEKEDIKAEGFYEDCKQYDFYKAAKQVNIPVLIIHKTGDDLVPVSQSKKLFDNLKCEKKLELIHGEGHRYEGDDFEKRIQLTVNWIQKHLC